MRRDRARTTPVVSRRGFLRSTLAAFSVVACGGAGGAEFGEAEAPIVPRRGDDLADIPVSLADFPLGISAGDARDDTAIVWTRYAGSGQLRLRIMKVEGGGEVPVADQDVVVGPDGFTHVDLRDLAPGARYRYVFVARSIDGVAARSETGAFRAALGAETLEPLTFGGVSCTHHRAIPFPTLLHAATQPDLDFFLHNGDKAYCDGANGVAEYRAKYVPNWSSDGMARLHRSVGWYNVWDDHEVYNDWIAEAVDPARPVVPRRVYLEHNPIRTDPAHPERLWRSFTWGRTAEVFVLECRSERKVSTSGTPAAQYISPEQLAWLKDGLSRSQAMFKLVVNSVPIATFPAAFDPGLKNRWQGYAAQRDEILGHIRDANITGVFWLSGDIHAGGAGLLDPPGGPFAAMREILMGPGGNIGNPKVTTHCRAPQWEFTTTRSNYVLFRADPAARELGVTWIDGAGQQLFATKYPV